MDDMGCWNGATYSYEVHQGSADQAVLSFLLYCICSKCKANFDKTRIIPSGKHRLTFEGIVYIYIYTHMYKYVVKQI